MKKLIVFFALACSSFAVANTVYPVGDNLDSSPENVTPAFHTMPKEQAEMALNYVNQPPLIPHSIKGYQVTKNVNQCLQCHSPQNARVTGAPRISATHFMDRDGRVTSELAPRRYFCLQCHVPQANVKPIVKNEFQPLPGYGN